MRFWSARSALLRVRTGQKLEGWIELRALVPREIYDQFQRLSSDNRATPVEGHGVTRVELNMHVSPGRETDTLYQLAESSKVELLKRATGQRATPEEIAAVKAAELAKAAGEQTKSAPKKSSATRPRRRRKRSQPQRRRAGARLHPWLRPRRHPRPRPRLRRQLRPLPRPKSRKPKPMDDWWLVRDQQGHVGWVLARMVDLDIPLDVAQYAEGQRIQAAFVLNTVQDEVKGAIPQYLVLLNENKDGIPYDFNQVRVFTWNLKRHRYETGYREHFIIGYFPATVSIEDFGKEGWMPVFTIRKQNDDGSDQRAQVPRNRQRGAPGACARRSAAARGAPARRAEEEFPGLEEGCAENCEKRGEEIRARKRRDAAQEEELTVAAQFGRAKSISGRLGRSHYFE